MQIKTPGRWFGREEADFILLGRLLCVLFCVAFWIIVYKFMVKVFS
jgi:hypothetical protein